MLVNMRAVFNEMISKCPIQANPLPLGDVFTFSMAAGWLGFHFSIQFSTDSATNDDEYVGNGRNRTGG